MSGINFSALKSKLNQFTKQNDRADSTWKPTEGKTTIRIVPWKENPELPFIEMYFHYLGNKTLLSPNTWGNRDPIAEFADQVAAGGTKDDWAQARAFRPKLRTYVPVIVRGEEEKGVRFMSFGKTVYTELLSIIDDPDYGDITDVKTGRDIVVDYTPQEKSDTNFAKTVVRPKPKDTPLSDDPAKVAMWLKDQPNIREMYKEPTFEELKIHLAKYLNPDEDTPVVAKPASVTESLGKGNSATSAKASASVKGITDDFDRAFN